MTKGDLDGVQIWGRPIKPVALGLSLLMLTLAVVNITDTGVFEDMLLGDVVAVLAVGSFTALMVGWFARYQIAAEIGLFSASVVYLIRGSFAVFTGDSVGNRVSVPGCRGRCGRELFVGEMGSHRVSQSPPRSGCSRCIGQG